MIRTDHGLNNVMNVDFNKDRNKEKNSGSSWFVLPQAKLNPVSTLTSSTQTSDSTATARGQCVQPGTRVPFGKGSKMMRDGKSKRDPKSENGPQSHQRAPAALICPWTFTPKRIVQPALLQSLAHSPRQAWTRPYSLSLSLNRHHCITLFALLL